MPKQPANVEGCILVVDDEPGMVDVLRDFLTGLGYQVLVARTAAEAMSCLAGSLPIDVVLLDLLLPDRPGMEVLRWMRREQLMATPVLLVTGYPLMRLTLEDDVMRGVDWIAKPFVLDDLRDKVKALLAPPPPTPPVKPSEAPSAPSEPPPDRSPRGLRPASLSRRLRGDH
jgi:DNA-binding response OmpR family regulator